MSDFPRKGDRVRVVYEGRVVSCGDLLGDVRVVTDTGHFILTGRSANSIEVLERTYAPGTVAVHNASQTVRLRLEDGRWASKFGLDGTRVNDDYVWENDYTIIHEPAA